ncbi:MAG: TonB family protein [Deltaproteobacteria bacterium]|nr:TonB family protein [Deltaproteobacteria bacterium]
MSEERITKIIYVSVVFSLLIHFGLGVAVVKGGTKDIKKETIISFNVVKEAKKEILPEPAKEEPKPEPPKPKPRKVVDLTKKVKIVKPEEIKEVQEKPQEAQNASNFGIDKSLVDTSGKSSVAMAIPIGETMIGDPRLRKGTSDKFVKPAETMPDEMRIESISQMPKVLKEVKPKYPEEARRLGIEGSVILSLEIDENGNVVSAKVIKKMGYGMDEEALKAAYQLKFLPAMAGKTPVAAKIKYTFTFILED